MKPSVPPLLGIRVLDLARLLPGNVCSWLLAQLGAEIIKIEDPHGGDYGRWFPPRISETSAFFQSVNRGKRSIILDLKHEPGRQALHRLVASADVLLEGFRPGVMARLGCGYEELRLRNPRLIYCALSGWGQEGPYAQRSAHDLNYIAAAGLADHEDGQSHPPPTGQMADVGGAYLGAAGILAALLRREREDVGSFVDISLAEAALPFALIGWVETLARPQTMSAPRRLSGGLAAYASYRARCGRIVTLSALEAKFWRRFALAVGREDWLLVDHSEASRQDDLREELRALFASKTATEWETLLGPADCCFEVAAERAAPQEHPQHHAREMLGIAADGAPWLRSPIHLRGTPPQPDLQQPAPRYGADTCAVLEEAGYSEAEVADLLASGAAVQLGNTPHTQ